MYDDALMKVAEKYHNLKGKEKEVFLDAIIATKETINECFEKHPELKGITNDPVKMRIFQLGVNAGLGIGNKLIKVDTLKIEHEISTLETEIEHTKAKLHEPTLHPETIIPPEV